MLKGWGLSAPAYPPPPCGPHRPLLAPREDPPPRCFYFPPLWAQTWGGANQAFCSTTVAGGELPVGWAETESLSTSRSATVT